MTSRLNSLRNNLEVTVFCMYQSLTLLCGSFGPQFFTVFCIHGLIATLQFFHFSAFLHIGCCVWHHCPVAWPTFSQALAVSKHPTPVYFGIQSSLWCPRAVAVEQAQIITPLPPCYTLCMLCFCWNGDVHYGQMSDHLFKVFWFVQMHFCRHNPCYHVFFLETFPNNSYYCECELMNLNI